MSALNDARAHLEKARESLEAAEINKELDLYNAATSDAVISGNLPGFDWQDEEGRRSRGRGH